MTWENRDIPSGFDFRLDAAVSRFRHVFTSLRLQPAPPPWVYERLATREEIAELAQTDLRRAA